VELVLIWALFALVASEIVVTYARIAPRELYHVSGSGIEGGLSRALVFVNFPTALVALAVIAFLYEQLPHKIIAAPAAVLCAVLLWPGVVSQANLDARPVNALPAAGVVLALVLTFEVAHRHGLSTAPWRRPDWARLGLGLVVLLAAVPWLAADLGLSSNGIPLLGQLFQSNEYLPERPGLSTFAPAVHYGHHHGMDGTLLVVTALLLSRRLGDIASRGLRRGVAAYLALMFCYGMVNIANDFWIEQVVKRDWTRWEIPNVLEPRATIAWGLILLASLVLWALWARLVDWGADEESPLRAEPDGLPARR
jgi:hypothetical protein